MPYSYNYLLDITLELEGLIMLKMRRGDLAPKEVDALIVEKVDMLHRVLHPDQQFTEEQLADLAVKVYSTEGQSIPETPATPAAQATQAEPTPQAAPEEPAPQAAPAPQAPSEAPAPQPPRQQPHQPPQPQQPQQPQPRQLAFALNDKFRFRRELFGGDDEEMSATVDVISRMASMEEVEDYLYNDLCWDPATPEVRDFISNVERQF